MWNSPNGNTAACTLLALLVVVPFKTTGAQEQLSVKATDVPGMPESFMDLVERGKVEFKFYERQTREFPGETHFEFRSKHKFRLAFNVTRNRGKRIADVSIRVDSIEIECRNQIYLPARLRGDGFWDNRLVVHEFEHVQLNCDARPKLLAETLLKRLGRARVPLTEQPESDSKVIDEFYAARAEDVRKEIVRIMQANNDFLDELTLHGAKQLEDAESFFAELYTQENLEKYQFAYLEQVRSLLQKKDYR